MPISHTSGRSFRLLAGCLLTLLAAGARTRAGDAPLTRLRTGHLTVAATINGQSLRLVVDTGCPVTVIGEEAAGRLNLPEAGGPVSVSGSKLKTLSGQAMSARTVEDLKIAGADLSRRRVAVIRLDAVLGGQFGGRGGAGADGILGADLLADRHAVVDFARATLTLDPPRDTARQAVLAGYTPVRWSPTNRWHVAVPCIIGNDPGRLVVDTGSPYTVMRRAVVDPVALAEPRRVSLMRTLSGVTPVVWVPLRHWNIGAFPVGEARVGAGDFRSGIFAERTRNGGQVVGLLGLEWLAQWQAVVDFGTDTLYLKHR